MKKYIVIVCLLCSLWWTSVPLQAQEETFAPEAKSAFAMEYSTQRVVFSKEENKRMFPASMTKMMSLVLVYEALNNKTIQLSDEVLTSAYAASMGGSQVFLEEGERMSVKDLLKSVCIASANDAMVALAEKTYGSETLFVAAMNKRAAALGLKQTHFMNTTGLHDENHYSSAKDMAYISKALLDIGGSPLLSITSTYEDYIREDKKDKFWLVNTNKLLRNVEGVDGLKTGYTSQALSCISISAKRNDVRFIVVVMGAPTSKVRNDMAKQLIEYSFTLFEQKLLFNKNKKVSTKTIEHSVQNKVNLRCEEDVVAIHAKGENVNIVSQEVEWLNKDLPYKKGDRVAKLRIQLDDNHKITTYLISDSDVDKRTFIDIFKGTAASFF